MPPNSRDLLRSVAAYSLMIATVWYVVRQCRKPSGWLGRLLLWTMNNSHARLTSWGLSHVEVRRTDTVLDVGCGGGSTIRKIAALADLGVVHGVDYSSASVAASKALNKVGIAAGTVTVQDATVSHLPFPTDSFDLVTAIETHYYWPDLPGDIREILRVLKPGGTLLIVAEVHKSGRSFSIVQLAMKPLGGVVLSPDDHRDWFTTGGLTDVQVFVERSGWICVTGRKPLD